MTLGGHFGDASWDPGKHPRQPDGKFGTKTWTKIGEKLGSNEGGTYQHADGTKYYVKFPNDPEQAKTEALSARLAEIMGIKTTSPDWNPIDGKIAVVSPHQDLKKIDFSDPAQAVKNLDSVQRYQLAKIYYHAQLTKNWDVLGVDSSNIMMDEGGNLVQMDTGGSFEFRAQGKHKNYGIDITDTDLFDDSMPSGKVFNWLKAYDPSSFNAARVKVTEAFKADGVLQVFNDSDLKNRAQLKLDFQARLAQVEYHSIGVGTAVVKPLPKSASPAPIEEPGKHLTVHQKLKRVMKSAYEMNGAQASTEIAKVIKVPPPPITVDNAQAVSRYVGSSTGMNSALRDVSGNVENFGYYSKANYQTTIEHLDKLFGECRDFAIPIKVLRGMPSTVLPDLKIGDTFVDHGYQSTSFSSEVAKNFGQGNTVLKITLPKGFKFLAVPSFSKAASAQGKYVSDHATQEAEALLPRGTGYEVKKIEQESGHRILHVNAIFSSLQPPGTEWKSTKSKKVAKP